MQDVCAPHCEVLTESILLGVAYFHLGPTSGFRNPLGLSVTARAPRSGEVPPARDWGPGRCVLSMLSLQLTDRNTEKCIASVYPISRIWCGMT